MTRVAVTGGAGYIGAHVVHLLTRRGDDIVVLDDLSTGRRERVPATAELIEVDLASPTSTDALVDALHGVDAVIHLAARKSVPESVERPVWYAQQNVGGTVALLSAMREAGVGVLIFSSSAAVYGDTRDPLVSEETPLAPVNPYGRSKLYCEWLANDSAAAWGLRQTSLRYFNVAGAGSPEMADTARANLVTIALDRWRRGLPVEVFGSDYPTPDGSPVRDFVHVEDVAEAHIAALDSLLAGTDVPPALNIGTGVGTSVSEMLRALAATCPWAGSVRVTGRRPGDTARVVADTTRATKALAWRARHSLASIASSAADAAGAR